MLNFILGWVTVGVGYLMVRRMMPRRTPAMTAFLLLSAFIILLSATMLDDEVADAVTTSKSLKHTWAFKTLFKPKEMTTMRHSRDHVYVFQHVPRTGGDAMETTAFGTADLSYAPVWPHQAAERTRGPFDSSLAADELSFVSGYFSRTDLETLERMVAPRKLRIFTFLRHPVERILSLARFCKKDLAKKSAFGNGKNPPTKAYWRDFGVNSLTRQFGDSFVRKRSNTSMTSHVALARAKEWLDTKVEFVGFFEDLPNSYWRLHSEFLSEDVSVPFIYPFLFWVGAIISSPRRTVRKFTNRFRAIHPDVLENVIHWQKYDLELYEYAVQKYNPSVRLYDSYWEFFLAHWVVWLVLSAFIITPLLLVLIRQRSVGKASAPSRRSLLH